MTAVYIEAMTDESGTQLFIDDPTVSNVAALQCAFDVAEIGDTVVLRQKYGVAAVLNPDGKAATRFMGQYESRYSLALQKDGVSIVADPQFMPILDSDGHNNIGFKLLTMPPASLHNAIPFQLLIIGSATPQIIPHMTDVIPHYGNQLQNIGFEVAADVVSQGMEQLNGNGVSGEAAFIKCLDAHLIGCEFRDGWGHTGVVTAIVGCERNFFNQNRILANWIPGANGSWHSAAATGMWLDGWQYGFACENHIERCNVGIGVATNADNARISYQVTLDKNIYQDCYSYAVGGKAENVYVTNSRHVSNRGSLGMINITANDILLTPAPARPAYPALHWLIQGNSLEFTGSATVKAGIFANMVSRAVPAYPGVIDDITFKDNVCAPSIKTFIQADDRRVTRVIARTNTRANAVDNFLNDYDPALNEVQ